MIWVLAVALWVAQILAVAILAFIPLAVVADRWPWSELGWLQRLMGWLQHRVRRSRRPA